MSPSIAIVGLGYVGLPLSLQFARSGVRWLGLDIDASKVDALNSRRSHIRHIDGSGMEEQASPGRFEVRADLASASQIDAVVICVPPPLSWNRECSILYRAPLWIIAPNLWWIQLFIRESTMYSGITDEDPRDALESMADLEAWLHSILGRECKNPKNTDSCVITMLKLLVIAMPAALEQAEVVYSRSGMTLFPAYLCRPGGEANSAKSTFCDSDLPFMDVRKAVYGPFRTDMWAVVETVARELVQNMTFNSETGGSRQHLPVETLCRTKVSRKYRGGQHLIKRKRGMHARTNKIKYRKHKHRALSIITKTKSIMHASHKTAIQN